MGKFNSIILSIEMVVAIVKLWFPTLEEVSVWVNQILLINFVKPVFIYEQLSATQFDLSFSSVYRLEYWVDQTHISNHETATRIVNAFSLNFICELNPNTPILFAFT